MNDSRIFICPECGKRPLFKDVFCIDVITDTYYYECHCRNCRHFWESKGEDEEADNE